MLAGTTCSSPAEIYNYVRTMGLFVYAMYMSCMCHACALHGYLNCHKRTVLSLCIYLSHSVSLSVSTLLSVVITLIQYLASAHYRGYLYYPFLHSTVHCLHATHNGSQWWNAGMGNTDTLHPNSCFCSFSIPTSEIF